MVDEEDSKSFGSDTVWVRVPPPAPMRANPNLLPISVKRSGLLFVCAELKMQNHITTAIPRTRYRCCNMSMFVI